MLNSFWNNLFQCVLRSTPSCSLCTDTCCSQMTRINLKVSSAAILCISPNIFADHKLLGSWLICGTYYCSHRCTKARSDIVGREALVNPQLTGGCSTPPKKWQHVWLGQAEPGAAKAEPAGVELPLSAHCWLGSWVHVVSMVAVWLHAWAQGILRKGLCFCSLAVESPLLVIKADEYERKSCSASNSHNPFQSLLASYSQIAAAKI